MNLAFLIALFFTSVYCMGAPFGPIDIPAEATKCKAGIKCRFLTCSNLPIIFFTAPGSTSFPPICRRGQNIGPIFDIAEPMVKTRAGGSTVLTKISEWQPGPPGNLMSPLLAADTFIPGNIPGIDNSGITRKTVRGNQNRFTHGTCFVVPVRQYAQIKNNGRTVIKNVSDRRDCFVFVANVPDIVFEVQWFGTGDDLDLSLEEPDGTVIDYINPRSQCGRLNGGDKNIDGCELKEEEREKIEYFRSCGNFQTGTYKATVRHTTNCEEGLTRYELRILVDGRVAPGKRKIGTTNSDLGQVVDTISITF